jgi:hypothetical protein
MNIFLQLADEPTRQADHSCERQHYLLQVVEDLQDIFDLLRAPGRVREIVVGALYVRALLRAHGVSEAEIGWLESTNRLPADL